MRVKYEEGRIAARPISILVIWSHEVLQCQDLARREERPRDDGDTDIDIKWPTGGRIQEYHQQSELVAT